MATSIMSFGIKHGPHRDVNTFVVDIRELFPKNPHYMAALRPLTGLDPSVGDFIRQQVGFDANYFTLKAAVAAYPGAVAINCTGGKHRSVYLAERIGRELNIPVFHRDLNKE